MDALADLRRDLARLRGRDRAAAGLAAPAVSREQSQIALDPESFWTVLHDGALLEKGMPRFDNLSRDQAMQIYAYIRSGAREALGIRQPKAGAAPTPAPVVPGPL